MLVPFLKRLSYKDLKTVKTLKIQQGNAKIWRFKVLFLQTKWRIFQTFKHHHIFALIWRIFNVFTVLRSL
jgi:hypothetical protein